MPDYISRIASGPIDPLFINNRAKIIYVGPRMGTDSFCVMCLPICEFLAIPARLRTGSPDMRTGVGNDPRMQTFAYGDRISNFPYAHEHIIHTVCD